MKVIKRNGSEVDFNITKIMTAIEKANETVDEAAKNAAARRRSKKFRIWWSIT